MMYCGQLAIISLNAGISDTTAGVPQRTNTPQHCRKIPAQKETALNRSRHRPLRYPLQTPRTSPCRRYQAHCGIWPLILQLPIPVYPETDIRKNRAYFMSNFKPEKKILAIQRHRAVPIMIWPGFLSAMTSGNGFTEIGLKLLQFFQEFCRRYR